ncbi:MAG TPA: hypothetical protein VF506_18500, partial [Streptosporangiaceae bacterium]
MSDLVPLLYRPRVARFGLSGELRSRTTESGSRVWQEHESFEIDPDGRYRSEVIDDDGDRAVETGDSAEGRVPLPELMISTRELLHGFDLQITGQTEFLRRPVIAITGSPRRTRRHVTEQVSGLVDAELGIFLRFQRVSSSQTESVEFTRLTVIPPKPQGVEQDSGPLPSSLADPFSPQPTEPELTDDQVNLLYRSDLGPQRFAAELSEQTDVETIARLGREAVAATKFGRKTQWLWDSVDDYPTQNVDMVAQLAVAMPDRYRIEAITDPRSKPTVIACNGRRLWRAYPDRVAVRAAEPPPERLTAIIDPSWLLNRPVSVIGDAEVAGRAALHLRAVGDWPSPRSGTLSETPLLADRVDAFIDRALGICLRL